MAASTSTSGAPTRTDRRRERTRQQLTAAARDLITQKGVAGLRIADLTDTADVGRGSFYNHFESKEDLVDAVVKESLETLAQTILADIPADLDPAVRASYADRRFIGLARENPDFARLLVHLNRGDDLFTAATLPYARMTLAPGVESGRFDVPDLDVMLLMLAGGAFALIRAILDGDAPEDAEQSHAESILRLLGLPHDEAREISRLPLGP
jgi:AcrR family transcriptional regulator